MKEEEVYTRIYKFRSLLEKHIKRGKKNAILLENSGLKILERVKELESEGNTLRTIQDIINRELNSGNQSKTEDESELTKTLKDEINFLREQLKVKDEHILYLQGKVDQLTEVIQLRLPPTPEEVQKKIEEGVSRWERFKQFLKGE